MERLFCFSAENSSYDSNTLQIRTVLLAVKILIFCKTEDLKKNYKWDGINSLLERVYVRERFKIEKTRRVILGWCRKDVTRDLLEKKDRKAMVRIYLSSTASALTSEDGLENLTLLRLSLLWPRRHSCEVSACQRALCGMSQSSSCCVLMNYCFHLLIFTESSLWDVKAKVFPPHPILTHTESWKC